MGLSPRTKANQTEMQAVRGGRPRSEQLHQAILQTTFDLVLRDGFRAVSLEGIAATAGVSKATIYRRWPNKAAVVMDAFTNKVGSGTLFHKSSTVAESIRLQMRAMAKSFRGSDGTLVKALLAESEFDPELAKALQERWTLPRRRMAILVIQEAIRKGEMHSEVDPEDVIDILYGPIYYRLQRNAGALTNAYIDRIFHTAMKGLGTKNS
ncbi:MAG: Transcriptional regulator, TetR family [Acidobacteriaceae bacterium]|nr:Transcriptional regulator, TetR family [Acidobacteriaceae bacterium]